MIYNSKVDLRACDQDLSVCLTLLLGTVHLKVVCPDRTQEELLN